uniref:Uncharacterized protein n=1 Tax=Anguilla anguilla TaxID=7936 RepID=A0A0E9STX4_ANGAN
MKDFLSLVGHVWGCRMNLKRKFAHFVYSNAVCITPQAAFLFLFHLETAG